MCDFFLDVLRCEDNDRPPIGAQVVIRHCLRSVHRLSGCAMGYYLAAACEDTLVPSRAQMGGTKWSLFQSPAHSDRGVLLLAIADQQAYMRRCEANAMANISECLIKAAGGGRIGPTLGNP